MYKMSPVAIRFRMAVVPEILKPSGRCWNGVAARAAQGFPRKTGGGGRCFEAPPRPVAHNGRVLFLAEESPTPTMANRAGKQVLLIGCCAWRGRHAAELRQAGIASHL
jgi:hypothetical protein